MAKSKTRKNRSTGPHKNLQQLAATRAGKNFARMVTEKATEAPDHRLSIALSDEEQHSTEVRYENGEAKVADPAITEFIMTSLASLQQAAITLETLDHENELIFKRAWLVDGGVFYPATAEEARKSAEDHGPVEPDVVFRDAFRLT